MLFSISRNAEQYSRTHMRYYTASQCTATAEIKEGPEAEESEG